MRATLKACKLAALAVLVLVSLGWAAEAPAAATSPFQGILTSLMQLVALVLAGLIATAAGFLLKKLRIDISSEQQNLIRQGARDAVFFAEEWAARKYGADKLTGKGAEQLAAATSFLLGKIPGLDQAAAQDAIHAALGRAPGLGASGAPSA